MMALFLTFLKAFAVGGLICCVGQALLMQREAVCVQHHGSFVHLMLCVSDALKSHFTNPSTGHTVPHMIPQHAPPRQ